MFAQRVGGPVLKIVQLWQDFQQAGLSVRRLGDILNTRSEPGYQPGRSSLPQIRGRVIFERVSFRYRTDAPLVLRDLTLEIEPGEIVGITGRSGCGKSTLARLMQRLHAPEAGRVLVDGVDLAGVDRLWIRRGVGVVLQDSELFRGSVRDNISLATPGLPMPTVERAARLAGAHEFILTLADGYDTEVGEQGNSLSGGQRQRIALARALISDPRILILDEATSALDFEAEQAILDNLREIGKNRTLIIIAHRLSLLSRVDRVVVIDQGRILEQGRHHELIRYGGHYARLHACQRIDGASGSAR